MIKRRYGNFSKLRIKNANNDDPQLEQIKQSAFMDGYQYAIEVLQNNIVKK